MKYVLLTLCIRETLPFVFSRLTDGVGHGSLVEGVVVGAGAHRAHPVRLAGPGLTTRRTRPTGGGGISAAAIEEGEEPGEEGPQCGQGPGDEADARFDDGPASDAGDAVEVVFGRVVVEEVFDADQGSRARAVGYRQYSHSFISKVRQDIHDAESENHGQRRLDPPLELNIPQDEGRKDGAGPVGQDGDDGEEVGDTGDDGWVGTRSQ